MERRDRKRKAVEIAESPLLVSERISELAAELKESDMKLRKVIKELRDENGTLKKQLAEKTDECEGLDAKAAFLHPDAVIDRVRLKLWHHGDLSLLRKVIDPRTRVLRNTEGRFDRSLYLCSTPSKKGADKAPTNGGRADELSPKHESDEPPTPATAATETDNLDTEEKQQEAEPLQEEGQQQQQEDHPQQEEQADLFAAPAGNMEVPVKFPAMNGTP